MKKQYIKDLRAGMPVDSIFVISRKTIKKTKSEQDYCLVCLQDKDGLIDGIMWPKAIINSDLFEEGDFVKINGIVSEYKGTRQIEISSIKKVDEGEKIEYSDFIRATKKNINEMFSEMLSFIESIENKPLKKLLNLFFEDEKFSESFCNSTAAVQYHHAYKGGLLEHTLSVIKICDFLSKNYPSLNRDILLAGVILHDVGKIREYQFDEKNNVTIKISDEGKLLGHITIGYGMVLEKISQIKGFSRDLKDRLLHIILSHHGAKEFGSPKRPKILEAFVVYHVDHMDADVGGFSIILEESGGRVEWSEFVKNFERSIFLKELDLQEGIGVNSDDTNHEEVEDIDDINLIREKKTDLSQDELF
jgi:3'-5' exoribonuclease